VPIHRGGLLLGRGGRDLPVRHQAVALQVVVHDPHALALRAPRREAARALHEYERRHEPLLVLDGEELLLRLPGASDGIRPGLFASAPLHAESLGDRRVEPFLKVFLRQPFEVQLPARPRRQPVDPRRGLRGGLPDLRGHDPPGDALRDRELAGRHREGLAADSLQDGPGDLSADELDGRLDAGAGEALDDRRAHAVALRRLDEVAVRVEPVAVVAQLLRLAPAARGELRGDADGAEIEWELVADVLLQIGDGLRPERLLPRLDLAGRSGLRQRPVSYERPRDLRRVGVPRPRALRRVLVAATLSPVPLLEDVRGREPRGDRAADRAVDRARQEAVGLRVAPVLAVGERLRGVHLPGGESGRADRVDVDEVLQGAVLRRVRARRRRVAQPGHLVEADLGLARAVRRVLQDGARLRRVRRRLRKSGVCLWQVWLQQFLVAHRLGFDWQVWLQQFLVAHRLDLDWQVRLQQFLVAQRLDLDWQVRLQQLLVAYRLGFDRQIRLQQLLVAHLNPLRYALLHPVFPVPMIAFVHERFNSLR